METEWTGGIQVSPAIHKQVCSCRTCLYPAPHARDCGRAARTVDSFGNQITIHHSLFTTSPLAWQAYRLQSFPPAQRAVAIVNAVAYYDDPAKLAAISRGLGEAMSGQNTASMEVEERLAGRGW